MSKYRRPITWVVTIMLSMFAILGFMSVSAVGAVDVNRSPNVSEQFTPEKNNPDAWVGVNGSTQCWKHEGNGGSHGSVQSDKSVWKMGTPPADKVFTLLVLKSGQVNDVWNSPENNGLYGTASGKDISHAIVCKGPKQPTPCPTVTINVPGPTVTATVPGPTVTATERVEVPGPTVTATVPGPTETVTLPPEPNETITATATVTATATATETVTATPPPVIITDTVTLPPVTVTETAIEYVQCTPKPAETETVYIDQNGGLAKTGANLNTMGWAALLIALGTIVVAFATRRKGAHE